MLCKDYMLTQDYGCEPAFLTAYVPDVYEEIDLQRERPAIILCPGGGYLIRSRTEAEPVALRYAAQGINVFVLEYALAPEKHYPTQLRQIAAAVAYVRRNAHSFHTNPDQIIVSGFSAGGHLSAHLGVTWDQDALFPMLSRNERRPNGMILCYPRLMFNKSSGLQMLNNLYGPTNAQSFLLTSNLPDYVTPSTPPAFIWHTFSDPVVPVSNSLCFAEALSRNHVACELHIFQNGPHGLGLANDLSHGKPEKINAAPSCRIWIDLAIRWVRECWKPV